MRFELLALSVLALGACGVGDDGLPPDLMPPADSGPGRNFAQIQQTLQHSCTFSVCHSAHGVASSGGLDLSSDTWLALVGVPAHNARAKGEALSLVKPCDPEHSFLFIKLTLSADAIDPGTGYGGHMPASNAPLSADELLVIHDWIARGALLPEPDDVEGSDCRY